MLTRNRSMAVFRHMAKASGYFHCCFCAIPSVSALTFKQTTEEHTKCTVSYHNSHENLDQQLRIRMGKTSGAAWKHEAWRESPSPRLQNCVLVSTRWETYSGNTACLWRRSECTKN